VKNVFTSCRHFSPQTPPSKKRKQRDKRALVLRFALLLALPSSSSSTSAQFAECCKWTGREKAAVHLVSCRQYCGEL